MGKEENVTWRMKKFHRFEVVCEKMIIFDPEKLKRKRYRTVLYLIVRI